MEREIQEVQDNLLQKRAEQDRMINLTPLISKFPNDNIVEFVTRLREKQPEQYIRVPEEQENIQNWQTSHYVPPKYKDCFLNNFICKTNAIERVKAWYKDGKDIFLNGNTGTGKTHIAIGIYRESKVEAQFITAPELLLEIRSSFKEGSVLDEAVLVKQYASYPLLVLDDLGAEKTSEYSIATLYLILDRRIRYARQTIITSNLSTKEIEETLGARIASRIAGMENLRLNMPDYRKKRER